MKKLITFIFVILSVFNSHAQDVTTDSLKQLLRKEKTDSGRVKLLILIGGSFGFGLAKNDSSLWYLQQARDLSKKNNYSKAEFIAEQHIAYYLNQTGNYPEALKLCLENIKRAQFLKDTGTLFYQTRLVSWIYSGIGDYKMALQYGDKLRSLARSLSNNNRLKIVCNAIANQTLARAFIDAGQLDSALHYFHLNDGKPTTKIVPQMKEFQAFAKFGLGDTYSKMGNYDSAFSFYMEALPLALQVKRIDVAARIKLSIAGLFQKRGDLDSAFFYSLQSLEDTRKTDIPGVAMSADSLLSQLYQTHHQYDSAYAYLKSFVILNDSLNNNTKITQAQNLSFNETLHEQQLVQAQKEAQQQYAAKIKLYIFAAIILIFLIIAFLQLRNIRNKRKANLLLSKQKEEIEDQKKNVESTLLDLKSTQKQLIQSEKMASLGELTAGIAHEIQNPLNFVNNFSDVNQELIGELVEEADKGNTQEVKEIANDIKANSEKINHHGKRADAIVKGMLQHSRTSSGVKEPTDINALCDEYLRLSYHGMRAKDKSFNATMKTDFDKSLSADEAGIGKINIVPQDIGRVLLNLINNAFYACAERSRSTSAERSRSTSAERSRSTVAEKKKLSTKDLPGFKNLEGLSAYEPTVSVSTKKSDNHVIITVSDNGNGIPQKVVDKIFQPFFTTKPTGEGTGLGLSLAYDIVKAHGGELKVKTLSAGAAAQAGKVDEGNSDDFGKGEGSEFIIQLPLK